MPTATDHRYAYRPVQLLTNGQRMLDDYTPELAMEDYLALHPDADQGDVWAELAKAAPEAGPAEASADDNAERIRR